MILKKGYTKMTFSPEHYTMVNEVMLSLGQPPVNHDLATKILIFCHNRSAEEVVFLLEKSIAKQKKIVNNVL